MGSAETRSFRDSWGLAEGVLLQSAEGFFKNALTPILGVQSGRALLDGEPMTGHWFERTVEVRGGPRHPEPRDGRPQVYSDGDSRRVRPQEARNAPDPQGVLPQFAEVLSRMP
jgi:hypothetical protein